MKDLPHYVAAIILDIALDRGGNLVFFVDEITKEIAAGHNLQLPTTLVEQAAQLLEALGGCVRIKSSLTGDVLQLNRANCLNIFGLYNYPKGQSGDPFSEAERQDLERRCKDNEVLRAYQVGEKLWLRKAVEGLKHQLEAADGGSVPASDRIVKRSDNQALSNEIDAALKKVEEVLRGNDSFHNNPEARVVAIAEISNLRAIWDAAQVRIMMFQARSSETLTWVAEKAASATIAELCRQALKLILGWS